MAVVATPARYDYKVEESNGQVRISLKGRSKARIWPWSIVMALAIMFAIGALLAAAMGAQGAIGAFLIAAIVIFIAWKGATAKATSNITIEPGILKAAGRRFSISDVNGVGWEGHMGGDTFRYVYLVYGTDKVTIASHLTPATAEFVVNAVKSALAKHGQVLA